MTVGYQIVFSLGETRVQQILSCRKKNPNNMPGHVVNLCWMQDGMVSSLCSIPHKTGKQNSTASMPFGTVLLLVKGKAPKK